MNHPCFTDKAGYLAWRKAWKKTYAENADLIRLHKRLRKARISGKDKAPRHQTERQRLRHVATDMLEMLKIAKEMAAEQRLEERGLAVAAE